MNDYSAFHNYAESQKVGLQFGNVQQGPRKAMRESKHCSLSDVILYSPRYTSFLSLMPTISQKLPLSGT